MKHFLRVFPAVAGLAMILAITASAQPGGGQCGGWGSSECDTTRQVVTVTGTVITVQDTTICSGTQYYLDTDADGVADYLLGFGPYWYSPTGLSRPTNGQTAMITGYLNDTVTPNHIRVISLNGSTWRDTTSTPSWHGGWVGQHGRQFRAQDSSVCNFPVGSYGRGMMGRRWTDSVYCRFDTTVTPFWNNGGATQGYHFTVSSSRGGLLMGEGYGGAVQFNNSVQIDFRYDASRFADESQLALWRYTAEGWEIAVNASINTAAHTVTAEENPLYEFYTLAPMSITSVRTGAVPAGISLAQNYPNPFNPSTTIRFSLAQSGQVSLTIMDLLGREVATVVDGSLDAGMHEITFVAADLPSGMYLYRLSSGTTTLTRKLILEK